MSEPSASPTAPGSKYVQFLIDVYQKKRPVVNGTLDVDKLEEKAGKLMREKKLEDAYLYTYGSAGMGQTHHDNRAAFNHWRIIPRMLVDATVRDLRTTLFGTTYDSPLFLSPVGVQGIVHPDGEIASARAAGAVNVPYIMSTASTRSIEDVAHASGNGPRWYQLYWPIHNEVTLSILSRAKAAGFTALTVTLDTMSIGWRPHDLDTAYLPFYYAVGGQVGYSDPAFMKRFGLEPNSTPPSFPFEPEKMDEVMAKGDETTKQAALLGRAFLGEVNSGKHRTWEDLAFLRENWEGPLLLKGIQSVDDAEKALEFGMDGIIVSNHGGRQVDGAIPSLYALDKICQSPKIKEAQLSGKFVVMFDSGIRTGSDIIKAIALGAQAVCIARPYMYGLMIAGQAGVEEVILSLLADLDLTLGLSGHKSIKDIWGKKGQILSTLDW